MSKHYTVVMIVFLLLVFGFNILIIKKDNQKNLKLVKIQLNEKTLEESVTENTTDIMYENPSSTHLMTESISETISETITELITDDITELYIDVNTATADELMMLHGIGPVISQEIITYRESNGYFKNKDELLNVKGIGCEKLFGIWNNIYVENEIFENNDAFEATSSYVSPIIDEISDDILGEPTEPLLLNLNNATKEDFMCLPYVTEDIADDIIELRTQITFFTHEYELLLVESLTQEQVAEIIKFVIVDE